MSEFTPSKYQKAVFDFIENESGSAVIEAVAGSGKCLGRNTKIMLFNGKIIPVQDVVVGDNLMGPDSKPRKVISTNIGKGDLFRIKPKKGKSWVCNDVHVLTLSGTNRKSGQIKDIPLNKLISETSHLPRLDRDWKLFRVPIQFEEKSLPFDPYLIGIWLGDGTMKEPTISNPEPEIHEYLYNVSKNLGLECKKRENSPNKCPSLTLTHPNYSGKKNSLRSFLKDHCIIQNEKRIPITYLRNSKRNQLSLLSGLLDTDGYYHNGYYEIVTKYKGLNDDILFLCRSIGLAAYSHRRIGRIKETGFKGLYFRITISGELDQIPCKVERKKAKKRNQIKDVLKTGFDIEYIGTGNYYGFTLDGDGRFLLGDFTVTHNTTTIIQALQHIPRTKSILFLAFNKAIADELKARVPSNVTASTFHSCGFSMLRNSGKKYQIKDNKVYWCFKDYTETMNEFNAKRTWAIYYPFVSKLVGLAKQYGEGYLIEDSWEWLISHFGLSLDDGSYEEGIQIAKHILDASNNKTGIIDFDDMIYLPIKNNVTLPKQKKYDFVFVDECQDVNPVQRAMLKKLLKPENGRLIAVGDAKQAIYGFRGSEADSLDQIKTDFDCTHLPLSICYRCGKNIVELSKNIVPHIEAFEDQIDGLIVPNEKLIALLNKDWHKSLPEDPTIPASPFVVDEKIESIAVLCRLNAPIVKLAYWLIRKEKPCYIRGREIGKGIVDLIKKFKVSKISDLINPLEDFTMKEVDRLTVKNRDAQAQAIQDRTDCIMVFIENCKTDYVSELITNIENLFSDDNKGYMITLSTVHKAKGLEWDHVFILDKEKYMPSKWAKQPWEKEQEMNLIYVAYTRAKKILSFISLGELENDKKKESGKDE